MTLNEPIVEDAALEWFRLRQGYGGQVWELGHAVGHGPQFAPGEPAAVRVGFGEVLLVGRLCEAIRWLNPDIPEEARATVAASATVQIKRRLNP